jgi:hypothetical protein
MKAIYFVLVKYGDISNPKPGIITENITADNIQRQRDNFLRFQSRLIKNSVKGLKVCI